MKYRYLYQNKQNQNCEGEIDAANRADAYTRLRKAGIRPYRVIGDDPFDWRPLILWASVATALVALAFAGIVGYAEYAAKKTPRIVLSPEEARAFQLRAEEAVACAPAPYRYNVWKGVNVRLAERGLPPIPRPADMREEDALTFDYSTKSPAAWMASGQ